MDEVLGIPVSTIGALTPPTVMLLLLLTIFLAILRGNLVTRPQLDRELATQEKVAGIYKTALDVKQEQEKVDKETIAKQAATINTLSTEVGATVVKFMNELERRSKEEDHVT